MTVPAPSRYLVPAETAASGRWKTIIGPMQATAGGSRSWSHSPMWVFLSWPIATCGCTGSHTPFKRAAATFPNRSGSWPRTLGDVHGHNPFFNTFLNTPSGINLMDNTTMPLLGILGAPITFLWGPIATWNVLLNLALASSALTFYLMARRFVRWRPAAFVAGLLYGFSPFVASEGVGHLFLVVGALPPLVILFLGSVLPNKVGSPLVDGPDRRRMLRRRVLHIVRGLRLHRSS